MEISTPSPCLLNGKGLHLVFPIVLLLPLAATYNCRPLTLGKKALFIYSSPFFKKNSLLSCMQSLHLQMDHLSIEVWTVLIVWNWLECVDLTMTDQFTYAQGWNESQAVLLFFVCLFHDRTIWLLLNDVSFQNATVEASCRVSPRVKKEPCKWFLMTPFWNQKPSYAICMKSVRSTARFTARPLPS